jgi:hypothetical protein
MNYLFLLLPFSFFVLSFIYRLKYNKVKNSGAIPVIVSARRNTELFLVLGLTLAFVLFIAIQADWLM